MPIRKSQDKNGPFFQPGTHGKKYHFNPKNIKSIGEAWRKAVKQTRAMYFNGYKGPKK